MLGQEIELLYKHNIAQDKESTRTGLNGNWEILLFNVGVNWTGMNSTSYWVRIRTQKDSYTQKEKIFDEYDKELDSHGVRLSDLISAASDAEEITLLKSKLMCNDFVEIGVSDISDKRGLIGTTINAMKSE